jgi:hypothetical protein
VPQPVLREFTDYLCGVAARNLALASNAIAVAELFRTNGVPAALFKGPALAVTVYGDLGLREFVDLDFLVHPRDLRRAKDLLLGAGYRLHPHFDSTLERFSPSSVGGYPLLFPGTPAFVIDLHSDLQPRFCSFSTADVLQDLRLCGIGNAAVPTISPEYLMLLLCVHGTKHWWHCLEWICCVAELSRKQSLDWELVCARSRRLNAERTLHLGVVLAHNLLGTEIPPALHAGIRADRDLGKLSALVQKQLFADCKGLAWGINIVRLQLGVRERFRDKAAYWRWLLMGIEFEGSAALPLPTSVRPFYWLLRAISTGAKYSGALWDRISAKQQWGV